MFATGNSQANELDVYFAGVAFTGSVGHLDISHPYTSAVLRSSETSILHHRTHTNSKMLGAARVMNT